MHTVDFGFDEANDEALFTELFHNYSGKMFHYFKKYLKHTPAAEDLVQEVFASVWNSRKHLLKDKNIEAYLFVSARNRLYNHLKKTLQAAPIAEADDNSASYSHVDEVVSFKETFTKYQQVLSSLSEKRRQAFILSREHGLSYNEISQRMNISPRTVEKHISEALQLLRAEINITPLIALFIIW